MPRMTPMTIPAIAPPLRPPPPAFDSTRSPLAPVGMGVEKGSVAVAEPVAVTIIRPELVGRKGADGFTIPVVLTPGVGPAIGLHVPSPVQ